MAVEHNDSSMATGYDEHSLHALIQRLRQYLGCSSGIDSANIDIKKLRTILADYRYTAGDWKPYGSPDPSRNYTRLLVDNINGSSNLLFIVWNPSKHSPVHDHADAHCVMKIAEGSLNEIVYEWPEPEQTCASPLMVKKETLYEQGEVAYISDKIGLHRIRNPSEENIAVSLHLYTPPNAAYHGFNIYNEKTGEASHVQGALKPI